MSKGRRSRRRALLAAGALALLASALTGCAALGIDVIGGPASTRATETVPSGPPAAPALDCSQFASENTVAALLGAHAAAADPPAGTLTGVASSGGYAASAAGGGWCSWGDDTTVFPLPKTWRALTVTLLPHAQDAWTKLAENYPAAAANGADYDGGVSRGGSCSTPTTTSPGSECRTNVLVGSSWLEVRAGASDVPIAESDFHAFVQGMLPAAARFDASVPVVTAPAPLACADPEWLAELKSVFGLSAVSSLGSEGSFDLRTAAHLDGAAMSCAYQPSEDGSGGLLGTLSVLRNSAGSYATYRHAAISTGGSAAGVHSGSITAAGQTVPTVVRTEQDGSTSTTVVDALVGTTWIQFAAADADEDTVAAYVTWVASRL